MKGEIGDWPYVYRLIVKWESHGGEELTRPTGAKNTKALDMDDNGAKHQLETRQ